MRSIIKKLWKMVTHIQVLSVFFAFALMVFFSYRFMSDLEHNHLINDVKNAISNTIIRIETELAEEKTTLNIVAENVRTMIINGVGIPVVERYLSDTAEYLTSDGQVASIKGVYGFFDDFYEGDGVSEPYIDSNSEALMITFSRQIFDNEGKLLGTICLDVNLDRIRELAVNTSVTQDSYGILLDGNFNVIAHPHPGYIGRNLIQMNDGPAIKDKLTQGEEISEREATDYNGNKSVLFINRLNNGWYLGIIAYSNKYYQSISETGKILIALGLVLAVGLSTILLSIVSAKKNAEDRTMMMLDAAPLAITMWDNNLNLIDVNLVAARILGIYTKHELYKKFTQTMPEYQADGRKSSEKLADFTIAVLKNGSGRINWNQNTVDGETVPFEITAIRLKHNENSVVVMYGRDMREINFAMSKMREADECTQVLFDATPLSCYMVDNTFKPLECNQEVVRLFGLPDKQVFIKRASDFYPEYQPSGELSKERMAKYVTEAFHEGYTRFEWMHQKLDGEQIPTEVSLVRVKYRGENAVAGYIRDLRELKAMVAEMRRAEMAEENSRAKSDFLAKMSHEIRTPMNAILGITEIQLQDNTLSFAAREALERIYNSGDILLGIINDILDLSKIEAGKLELNNGQYDIASLIHDIVKINKIRYESKPIEFNLEVSDKIPTLFIGDELRIKQILNNLLSNAFKYTYEGRIDLSCFTEPLNENSVMLVFRVSDTGQGMTSDQVKKLGEKFSRFNLEANRKTEGTGLGMNITRNLVNMMKGSISVESIPGMGSTFTVYLPQECADANPIGRELADNLMKLNIKNTTKIRNLQIKQEYMPYGSVLVVDDIETNLYVARGLLAPYGLSIDTVLSGFDAVDKVKEGMVYDIIFMDHMMPRMDGLEATKLIRSLGYKNPVVALTANAISGQAEMFMRNGFDDFISKPIDIRQLNTVLNKLIRDKQPLEIIEEARKIKESQYAADSSNESVALRLAEVFIRDAEKAAGILETICAHNFRRADDLSIFIINIHAMKSALANIGEKELSSAASELEQAGREKNVNQIISTLPKFIASLNKVIKDLKPEETGTEGEIDADDSANISFLNEKLLIIETACASLDKKTAKEALAELKDMPWTKAIRDKLSSIGEHLLHSDFEEAAAIAKETAQSYSYA
jgi:PAS domain S-box-containing protein